MAGWAKEILPGGSLSKYLFDLYILKIFKVRMFKCNDRMFIIHISYICLVIWGDPQYYIFLCGIMCWNTLSMFIARLMERETQSQQYDWVQDSVFQWGFPSTGGTPKWLVYICLY